MTFTLGFRTATRLMRTVVLHGSRIAPRHQPLVRFISSSRQTFSSTHTSSEVTQNDPVPENVEINHNRKVGQIMGALDRFFSKFEAACVSSERVDQRNYLKTFDKLTQTVQELEELGHITPRAKSSLAVFSAMLLRCCGNLMDGVDPKEREAMAASLWEFIKAKQIPLDISHYNSLLRVLNENNTQFDPQIIMDEIKSSGLQPDRVTFQRLIHRYCVIGDITNAMKLLESMKELNMELNEVIFASLITGYCQQPSPPSIDEIFELMKNNQTEPGSKSFTAAIKAQIPRLTKEPQDTVELEKIHSLMTRDDVHFANNDIIELITALNPFKSNETVAKVLEYLETSRNFRNLKDHYKMIAALLQIGEYKEASRIFWTHKPSANSIQRKNIGTNYIKLLVHNPNVPSDFCLHECLKIKDMGYNDSALILLFYFSASCGNLNLVRNVLNKLEEEQGQLKVNLYWPLLAQTQNEDEIIQILKEKFSNLRNRQDIIETLSLWVWPKFFDNIGKLFEINKKELHFPNDLLVTSLVDYAIQIDNLEKVVQFIIESPPEILNTGGDSNKQEEIEEDESEDTRLDGVAGSSSTASRSRNLLVTKVLNQVLEQNKDPEVIRKTYELFKGPQGFTSGALSAMVKVHLLRNNFNEALEVFIELSREHNVTPCKRELMKHCLENKDPETLQKIMDISTEIHGEMNSLFDLAISCLECGKLKQAIKILDSPGFRVRTSRVYDCLRQLTRSKNLKVAEQYVSLTKDLQEVEPEKLHAILLEAYERTSNASRALDLWNRMQEEDFHPSKKSLIMIANLLERNNIQVPFQRPTRSSSR